MTLIKTLGTLSWLAVEKLPVVLAVYLEDQLHLINKERSIRRMTTQEEEDDAKTLFN